MSGRRQKNGGGGDSDSDSGCNLELTLGGSYSEIDDEMPVLTLSSSSVFEIDGVKEDYSGGPNIPLPDEEFAVERSFLSLRMSLPPAVPEMRTIRDLQMMRRQEVKRRLMGKNRSRGGRPPLPNQIQSRILFPAISQPSPPPKTVLPSPPLSPTPASFFCVPPPPPTPSTSSPPLSPMPAAFRFPTPPPLVPAHPQHSSLPLCPMPLSMIRPRGQSSSPPLSPRPSPFQLPSPARPPSSELAPLVSDPAPHFPANGDGHKMAIPESLPVEILRGLVVRWMLQHKYKRLRASDRSDLDTGLDLIKQMPTVVATGTGPNGKRIEGFLCKFGTDEVSLVCICHGMFFTPADFVKHAGGGVVENPMKQIIVCPASF